MFFETHPEILLALSLDILVILAIDVIDGGRLLPPHLDGPAGLLVGPRVGERHPIETHGLGVEFVVIGGFGVGPRLWFTSLTDFMVTFL
jgi:hypothetical protein